jgi:hypothetical protein
MAEEQTTLNEIAAETGDGSVVQAVRVAEASASLQVVAASLEKSWVLVGLADVLPLEVDDAVTFASDVSVFNSRILDFEQVAPEGNAARSGWNDLASTRPVRDLHSRYRAALHNMAVLQCWAWTL